MRSLNLFLGGVSILALLALGACNNSDDGFDESYYAENASVNSSNSAFHATSTGGTISFTSEGGEVLLNVDCDIDWTATNSDSSWLTTTADSESNTLTVSAPQNYVENDLTSTITFKTAKSGIEFATVTVTQSAYSPTALSVGATEWHAPAVGVLSTDITVSASGDYEISKNAEWLTVTKTDTGITLTAAENETNDERSDEVTITCTDGYTTENATIAVTQDAKVYLNVSSTATIAFTAEGGSESVTVESNFDWTPSTDADWISFKTSGNTLTIVAAAEAVGEDHEAVVTITAGDGAENVATESITVTEEAKDLVSLILLYSLSEGMEIKLPLYSTVDCMVDWGDGSEPDHVTEKLPTHTYASAGEYKVSISGQVTQLNSYQTLSNTKNYYDEANSGAHLVGVEQWGNTGLTSLYEAFESCVNLKTVPEDTQGAFAEVTTLAGMFEDCSSLESVPEGLLAYAEKVTGAGALFKNCSSLKSVPAKLFANCPLITGLDELFYECSSLEAIPEGLFDYFTSGHISLSEAMMGCESIKTIPVDLFAHLNYINDLSGTFSGCTSWTGESPYNVLTIDGEEIHVHLYEWNNYPDYLMVGDWGSTFKYCTNLTDYYDIPSGWGGGKQ